MSKSETEGDDEKPPYIVRLEFDEYAREATELHVPPSIVARWAARASNAASAPGRNTRGSYAGESR